MRTGGGHARFDGAIVRPLAWRVGLLGHPRGLHSRRHHRHGCRAGHRDDTHLVADHDALQVQHAVRDWRIGRVGHHHATGAAVSGAGCFGRSARQIGGRHVPGRVGSVHPASAVIHRLYVCPFSHQARLASRDSKSTAHCKAGRYGRNACWESFPARR